MSVTDSLLRAYATLDLQPGAPPSAVRKQYLRLAKRWHPDRYATDPANQAYAADKMREINCAYQLLEKPPADLVDHPPPARPTPPPPPPPSPSSPTAAPGSRRRSSGWDSSRNEEVIQAILGRPRRDVSFSMGRTISLVIATAYLVAALVSRESAQIVKIVAFLIVSLWGIWYGDEMEGFVHDDLGRPIAGVVLKLAAWLLLLLPSLVGAAAVLSAR
jgi:hypothetical protein